MDIRSAIEQALEAAAEDGDILGRFAMVFEDKPTPREAPGSSVMLVGSGGQAVAAVRRSLRAVYEYDPRPVMVEVSPGYVEVTVYDAGALPDEAPVSAAFSQDRTVDYMVSVMEELLSDVRG